MAKRYPQGSESLIQLQRAVEEAEVQGKYTRSGKPHICIVGC